MFSFFSCCCFSPFNCSFLAHLLSGSCCSSLGLPRLACSLGLSFSRSRISPPLPYSASSPSKFSLPPAIRHSPSLSCSLPKRQETKTKLLSSRTVAEYMPSVKCASADGMLCLCNSLQCLCSNACAAEQQLACQNTVPAQQDARCKVQSACAAECTASAAEYSAWDA